MVLIFALKVISIFAFLYICALLFKVLKKYLAIRKLRWPPNATFILGHLTSMYDFDNKTMTLSENVVISSADFFETIRGWDVSVLWITWIPYIVLANGKAVEAVLSNNKVLSKSVEYKYFEPWIGNGLLVSEPNKWKQRRKLLTPTFHFRILEDFLKTMNGHSMILVDILKNRNEKVDLFEVIPLTTLDTICETAMGINVHAQRNPKSEFVRSVTLANEAIFTRSLRVLYWTDFIFYRTEFGKRYRKAIDFIHNFSRSVISERISELKTSGLLGRGSADFDSEETIFIGSKKRKIAFMDLLVQSHFESVQEDGSHLFSISDICEEVDTFMFEGFDTTGAAISWTLHLLGSHPDIQNKAYDEVFAVFGNDTERFVTVEDLSQLKYVECCIKEALRLYPSVPMFFRRTTQEIEICGNKIPSGVTLLIFAYNLHRDPKEFPEPHSFIPERFFEEREKARNPYAYIPFSAGPRNCIGQRFAMYEMKTIVTNVLRNFFVRSLVPTKDIRVSIEVITRTKSKLDVVFESRY